MGGSDLDWHQDGGRILWRCKKWKVLFGFFVVKSSRGLSKGTWVDVEWVSMLNFEWRL